MKVINLQEYNKDKAIENLKLEIDDLTVDNRTKAILNGLLDLNILYFKIDQDLANGIKELSSMFNLLIEDRIKPIEESLFVDTASFTKDTSSFIKNVVEILTQQKEDIELLNSKVTTLESKIR